MNTLIIYFSKYGCTADCASYLESQLSGARTLVDIGKKNLQAADLSPFDTIVIGSSIYIGAVSKQIRSFCKEQEDLLLQKKVGIFLCCALTEHYQEYLSKNFSAKLLEHAAITKSFGGDARPEKMSMIDKIVMKAAAKNSENEWGISRESMDEFIRIIE